MENIIKIGKITAAVGIKGEVRVYPYTDTPERFKQTKEIILNGRTVSVESARVMKNMAVVKLAGVNDRNAAEALQNTELFLERDRLWKMPEDTYFNDDLCRCTVLREDGTALGKLTRIVANPGHDLYEITKDDGKSFLLPAVKEFVKKVDIEAGLVTVHLIEGLEDL